MSERDKGRSSEPFWEESDVETLWLAFFFNILLVILNFRLITNRMEVWAAAFAKRCIKFAIHDFCLPTKLISLHFYRHAASPLPHIFHYIYQWNFRSSISPFVLERINLVAPSTAPTPKGMDKHHIFTMNGILSNRNSAQNVSRVVSINIPL
jgi:hypothetical protein